MKAMILAAGLGTRLKPYTTERPKALVEVEGRPLIAFILEKLVASGINEVVVNVHHFADMIEEYLAKNNFGIKIHISDERNRLLETGGGLLKAMPFLNGEESFLVHNVDILSDIDLRKLIEYHYQSEALATLAVGKRESSRHFLFNEAMQLIGWRNNLTGKEIITTKDIGCITPFAFAGIHVINPDFFRLVHSSGPFSIVDAYLSLCNNNLINGYNASNCFVVDVGKPNNIEKATEFAKKLNLSGTN
jgi:N-acetyl-alpha-D-muramate 1-phosphate uridylyltransferase